MPHGLCQRCCLFPCLDGYLARPYKHFDASFSLRGHSYSLIVMFIVLLLGVCCMCDTVTLSFPAFLLKGVCWNHQDMLWMSSIGDVFRHLRCVLAYACDTSPLTCIVKVVSTGKCWLGALFSFPVRFPLPSGTTPGYREGRITFFPFYSK